MAFDLARALDAALRAAGIPIVGVSIGKPEDPTTWTVYYGVGATAPQRTQGEALKLAFDQTSVTVLDAYRAAVADVDVLRYDVLATCALVAKSTDPTGWVAATPPQRIVRVRAMADDWKTFRAFVEKNL